MTFQTIPAKDDFFEAQSDRSFAEKDKNASIRFIPVDQQLTEWLVNTSGREQFASQKYQ